jgi:hypothetical protein
MQKMQLKSSGEKRNVKGAFLGAARMTPRTGFGGIHAQKEEPRREKNQRQDSRA